MESGGTKGPFYQTVVVRRATAFSPYIVTAEPFAISRGSQFLASLSSVFRTRGSIGALGLAAREVDLEQHIVRGIGSQFADQRTGTVP